MARRIFYTPIRRSHCITPFGVGSVILTRNAVSAVVCGLDEWMDTRPDTAQGRDHWVQLNRLPSDGQLERHLGVEMLVQPPRVHEDPNTYNTWFIPLARFPLSEYCINPRCRRMAWRSADEPTAGRCSHCEAPTRRGRWPTQQVPLVLACRAGHLSDIPWVELVHGAVFPDREDGGERPGTRVSEGPCLNPDLTYFVSTDITSPRVRCETCSAEVDLGDLRTRQLPCTGSQPWLPGRSSANCPLDATVLERTSTNLYFATVRSALHLPRGADLDPRVLTVLSEPVAQLLLASHATGGSLSSQGVATLTEWVNRRGVSASHDEVARHAEQLLAPSDAPGPDEDRSREIDALLEPTKLRSGARLIVEPQQMEQFTGPYFREPGRLIANVSAVPRLAETRVLVGFSRLEPVSVGGSAGYELLWGAPHAPLDDLNRDWLPANRVYGEGIFLLLDPGAVALWVDRTCRSQAAYRGGVMVAGQRLGARHVLVHTLAHVLLREAASICGYALPSLRERILVDGDDASGRTGFLLYTAEGDAYGTLGGLVELAQPGRFEHLLQQAAERAKWCGADPVCMSPPKAASLNVTPGCCHHCLLVPETTCELFNQALDRAALVGIREGVPGFLVAASSRT